jgi:hypothetical protein
MRATASTRRWSSARAGVRSSLVKIAWTCASTVFGLEEELASDAGVRASLGHQLEYAALAVIPEHWPSRRAPLPIRLWDAVVLNNDEIEVACDALWFAKSRSAADLAQERLWDRLQRRRTGDFGGSAHDELSRDEAAAALRALRFCAEEIALDQDERRLLLRLESV